MVYILYVCGVPIISWRSKALHSMASSSSETRDKSGRCIRSSKGCQVCASTILDEKNKYQIFSNCACWLCMALYSRPKISLLQGVPFCLFVDSCALHLSEARYYQGLIPGMWPYPLHILAVASTRALNPPFHSSIMLSLKTVHITSNYLILCEKSIQKL